MIEIIFSLASIILSHASPEINIVFAGDAMQHIAQIEHASQGDGTHDYSGYFDNVADYVSAADYAVVNLETPLGGKPYSGYPCFCAPDSYAAELKKAGFDMCLTANNHTLDRRHKGLVRTLDMLDSMKIDHIGTYRNKAERDSLITTIKNIKGFLIGFLNYTYGTNGIPVTGDVHVNFIDKEIIKHDVETLREAGAELIAVAMHWVVEYVLLPNSEQKKLADYLSGLGVDMIIGGHPHVIQPMEMRRHSDTGKNQFLVYSLGNFISNMKKTDTRGGAMAKVTITRDSTGTAFVKKATYSLVFTEPPHGKSNFRLVTPESYDGQWKSHCNAFEKNAMAIFNKHNINVDRELISISRSN